MKNIVYFFSILLICCACSTVDCPLNNRVLARYAFKKADGTADTLRDSLTVRAIRMENDTLLLNRGIDLTAFDIPVSYTRKEDILDFIFKNDDDEITHDTLWIEKENYPHLESVECGPKFFHTITNLHHTRNRIDRIELIKKNVAYESTEENFHIYLFPVY